MKRTIMFFLWTVLICISAVSFAQQISCDKLPKKTDNAFNDFAHMVEPGKAAQLEAELRQYWKATSIAVVVITVDTMNGNDQFDYSIALANCWGIGDQTNRGVLIFVSKAEHKISIRTGKGIEFLMTDDESGQIIRDDMAPLFKQGNPTACIDAGVQKVIAKLKTMSWDDRMAGLAKEKALADKRADEAFQTLMTGLGILGALALVVFFFVLARRASVRGAKRSAVKKLNDHIREEINQARALLDQTAAAYKNAKAPAWAMKEGKDHADLVINAINSAEELLAKSDELIYLDTDDALAKSNEAESHISKAFSNFQKIDQGLWNKIKSFDAAAPEKVESAAVAVDKAKKLCDENKEFGFITSFAEIANLLNQIEELKAGLNDPEKQKDICENADLITEKALKISTGVQQIIADKKKIDDGVTELSKKAETLRSKMSQVFGLLTGLKTKYPQSVWQQLQADFSRYTPVLDINSISPALVEIKRLNDLSVKDFAHASSQYDLMADRLAKIEKLFSDIMSVETQQNEAKKNYESYRDSVSQTVDEAIKKSKDSDVGDNAKSQAKKAASDFKQADHDASMTLIDWVILYQLLCSCKKTAEESISSADSDISSAESERQRVAREKRRREDNQSSAFSTYAATTMISSDSTSSLMSSGGNDSFGGFGGGSFGGGGADGGW